MSSAPLVCVYKDGVNVREKPSMQAKIVDAVDSGEIIVPQEIWVKHKKGWSMMKGKGADFKETDFFQPSVTTDATTVVDIEGILEGDTEEIPVMKSLLEERGWCFIKLSDGLATQADQVLRACNVFFGEEEKKKKGFIFPPNYGWQSTKDKEMFRVLTGKFVDYAQIPDIRVDVDGPMTGKEGGEKAQVRMDTAVKGISHVMDDICFSIATKVSPVIFDLPVHDLGRRGDLPLLLYSKKFSLRKLQEAEKRLTEASEKPGKPAELDPHKFHRDVDVPYGMLDVTLYKNKDKGKGVSAGKGKYNVAVHGDPGLFAISLASTAPGLKLHCPSKGTWHSTSDLKLSSEQLKSIGVLWCGATAAQVTGGRIRPCIHKVDVASEPRLTIWYEVCTREQVPEQVRRFGLHRQESVPVEKLDPNDDKTFRVIAKMLTGKSVEIKVKPSDDIGKIFSVIQDKEGIPPDKNRIITSTSEGCRVLEKSGRTVASYGMKEGTVLHMVLRLRGRYA